MRTAVGLLIALALAPAANAAVCPVKVSKVRGAAPLAVTFRASCKSKTYTWSFGDGKTGHGRSVTHSFDGGQFHPTLKTGHSSTRVDAVTSVSLRVTAPRKADYGETITLHAQVKPQVPVSLGGVPFRHGELTIKVTRPNLTIVAGPAVVHKSIVVKPRLEVRVIGSPTLGGSLAVSAKLRPGHAGSVNVTVDGEPSTTISTADLRTSKVVVTTTANPDWAPVYKILRVSVGGPTLSYGSRGPAVVALEARLRELHYALPDMGDVFDTDVMNAVYAFQSVYRLQPTGVVTTDLWRRLATATVPAARYGGDHVEVDKARQVLFLVRGGKVTLITHISTGATGNTPLGQWHVYGKVPGWSWVLWYPSYFLRGFAIHGYPSVPNYPASHGCVRIPMWLAPKIYPQIPVGSSIFIYL